MAFSNYNRHCEGLQARGNPLLISIKFIKEGGFPRRASHSSE